MELGNFLHEDKSVKVTGIEPGQWFVHSNWGHPYRVFQCASVTMDNDKSVGTVNIVTPGTAKPMRFSAFQCVRLDADYSEEALLVLQERAQKEYDAWLTNQRAQSATGRPAIGSMDHLKEAKS